MWADVLLRCLGSLVVCFLCKPPGTIGDLQTNV
jgi:hypothetical protein